jgi:hypothetical protein
MVLDLEPAQGGGVSSSDLGVGYKSAGGLKPEDGVEGKNDETCDPWLPWMPEGL